MNRTAGRHILRYVFSCTLMLITNPLLLCYREKQMFTIFSALSLTDR